MRKVLHIFKILILLAWLVFVVLVSHSCFMAGQVAENPTGSGTETDVPQVTRKGLTLSSGTVSLDTTDLVAVVTPSDLSQLDFLTELTSADFSGSTCYADIISWAGSHPNVRVTYTVTLPDGQTVPGTVQSLDLSGMAASDAAQMAQLLRFLPDVRTVELGTADPYSLIAGEDLALMQSARPEASFHYALNLLGQPVSPSDTEVDLTNLSSEQVDEAAAVLSCMSSLNLMHVNSWLSLDEVTRLHNAAPTAAIDYPFSVWGVDGNLRDEYLSFSHISMNDEGAAVRQILPLMVNLETLDMDTTNVSNGSMAAIRNDFPNVDVIWRIWFAGYSVRTDVERILASSISRGGEVTNEEASKLQYCTKVKYLDLGHNNVLSDISFARSMPELEVLILAINAVSDISPLADCPKLEYLEINSTNVTDLSPLANSMELRHLNIGRSVKTETNSGDDLSRPCVSDISPLYGLHDLERLWIGSVTAQHIPAEQIATMQECAPNCVIDTESGDPSQGEWRVSGERPNWVWEYWVQTGGTNGGVFLDPYNDRYALLREQFGYDNADQAYSLPQNDPLY